MENYIMTRCIRIVEYPPVKKITDRIDVGVHTCQRFEKGVTSEKD